MYGACPRHAPRLQKAVAILALLWIVPAWGGAAKRAPAEIPVTLQVLGASGRTATLDVLVSRPLVVDFVASNPVVAPIETGFELAFTPTLLGGGRVAVTLALSIAFLPEGVSKNTIGTLGGKRKVQRARRETYEVNDSFEVADGETRLLVSVPAGSPIFATTRIVAPAGVGSATMASLEVRLPYGGQELEIEPFTLLAEPQIAGVPNRQNSVRQLTRRSFVGDVVLGEAVTTQVESGVDMDVLAQVTGGPLGLDLGLRTRVLDERVPTFVVPALHGKQPLQLPVLRTLEVRTHVDVPDGGTVVLGGVEAPGAEALVLVTPKLIPGDGIENVSVRGRVVVGDGGTPKPPKREPESSTSVKELQQVAQAGQAMAVAQWRELDSITGYDEDGEPVSQPLETGARLVFTPTLLGGDDADLELTVDARELDPESERFRVVTSDGRRSIDLPVVHILQLDTTAAIESGSTLAVGGILQSEARPGRLMKEEALVLATPDVGAGGDPDAVSLRARVVQVSARGGPATSVSERVESGPVPF